MDIEVFHRSLTADTPPPGISLALQGLWWDRRGDWARAHQCAQKQEDAEGAAVHAYLHRQEGDLSNARYWYARAGRPMPTGTLAEEWDTLVALLAPRNSG